MRLDLSDPIWNRLYGPYGVRGVPDRLRRLAARWDAEAAQHLFWEELHHQEDLYPVTYAALPWLREIAPETEPVAEFLAQVLFSARRQGDAAAPFFGLSLRVRDHAHPWLAPEQRLIEADMAVLSGLADWLQAEGDGLAALCLAAVPAGQPELAAHLAGGHAGWHGARDLPIAMRMWADGEDLTRIRAEGAPRSADLAQARVLAEALQTRAPGLSDFLRTYATC
ncbi:hypothetical protein [Oceanicola sp. S124]|uniref:hypothetical protein n=1 Tax=Oceanicola sp. S124 TaxID=1042378 RepID=UPI00025599A9|nr:hypothetical protein [Oceanicola sp. S124]